MLVTGAGIVERKVNRDLLETQKATKVWLEREFDHLRIQQTGHRPVISDYRKVSKERSELYENLASLIITLPFQSDFQQESSFAWNRLKEYLFKDEGLKEGLVLVTEEIPHKVEDLEVDPNDLASI